jgi:alpha-beta hydrolase superfamily lysophospholipase
MLEICHKAAQVAKCTLMLAVCAITVVFVECSQSCLPVRGEEADPNDAIAYVQDGEFSQALHLPTYEWIPKDPTINGSILAVHGLTLHGKLYEVLCKNFAANGFYTCAFDMRGFGRCYTDSKHGFCVEGDCKRRVNYDKSYEEVVRLAQLIKQKYPNVPLYLMGESLGTCMCIKVAGGHPELVDGLILSGPTVEVNPLMFVHPKVIEAGTWGFFEKPRFQVNTNAFVEYLVSDDEEVVKELLYDPLCRKGLSIPELLKTRRFVSETIPYARKIKHNEPVLVIQGSRDRCMVPKAIVELSKNVQSTDQTLRWFNAYGHLLLETVYLRPAVVDAISDWLYDHCPSHAHEFVDLQQRIVKIGGKASNGKM